MRRHVPCHSGRRTTLLLTVGALTALTVTAPNLTEPSQATFVDVAAATTHVEMAVLPPAAPSSLVANNAGASSSGVAFTWSAVPNAARYEFVYRINGGGWSAVNSAGTATSWTGMPGPNVALGVQVRAVNQAGQAGPWSTEVTGYTLNTAPNVWASGVSTTQATLNWSASGANTAKYNFFFNGSGTVVWTTATSNTQGGMPGQGLPYNVCAVNPANVQGGCSGGTVTLPTPSVTLSGAYTVVDPYSGRPQYEIRLTAQEVGYNLATNQSTVNWSLAAVELTNFGSYNLQNVGAWSVNIGGCTASGRHNTDFRSKPVGYAIGLGSGSCTFGHNADGTLTIGISASDNAGAPFGSAAVSGAYTLSRLR
ncbi:MAG: hypothetical protein BGO26_00085 [Actinobacteria bacterium 69-20]|jgi:hypothetical protein|nr:MAG: hypothetical protein BGO26_00085 [Actinobacteria bacterium 69-20]